MQDSKVKTITTQSVAKLKSPIAVIVDALIGTGLKGNLRKI